jgi:hypothetical protein
LDIISTIRTPKSVLSSTGNEGNQQNWTSHHPPKSILLWGLKAVQRSLRHRMLQVLHGHIPDDKIALIFEGRWNWQCMLLRKQPKLVLCYWHPQRRLCTQTNTLPFRIQN